MYDTHPFMYVYVKLYIHLENLFPCTLKVFCFLRYPIIQNDTFIFQI